MAVRTISKTFSTMKTNVANFLIRTSSDTSFASLSEVFINDKYQDAWNRTMWSAVIDNDYTITTVANQTNYDLPLDFGNELFVANITDGEELRRYPEALWWKERYSAYSGGSISSSTSPLKYVILKEKVNSAHTGYGVIALDPTPSVASKTIAMPYKRRFLKLLGTEDTCTTDTENKIIASAATFITDGVEPGMLVKNTTDNTYGYVSSVDSQTQLTADWDICPDGDETVIVSNEVVIPDLDWIIELGAIGEALAYERQFAKSDYYLQKYEHELSKRIGQEKRVVNQLYQMMTDQFKLDAIYRFTGDASYDTI